MRLKGIEFGNVLGASGVQGFFGEGYWFHPYLKPFGLDFADVGFVAKTTVLDGRAGYMPLRDDFTPRERLPKCIYVKLWQGVALNAISLSGPGAKPLLDTGQWQERTRPFQISFMSVAAIKEERLKELAAFIELLEKYRLGFLAPFGLQLNYSCPNVGLHLEELLDEIRMGLHLASFLRIPLTVKLNATVPIKIAKEIGENHYCDGLCITNTIPYGQLPELIDWKKLFGERSPLEQYGGGGLSGRPLLPILLAWLKEFRLSGFTKPINAGGGILSLRDAKQVFAAGADSIFLGSIAFLRPWRVRGIAKALKYV